MISDLTHWICSIEYKSRRLVNRILLQACLYNGRVCAVTGEKPRVYVHVARFINPSYCSEYKHGKINELNKTC